MTVDTFRLQIAANTKLPKDMTCQVNTFGEGNDFKVLVEIKYGRLTQTQSFWPDDLTHEDQQETLVQLVEEGVKKLIKMSHPYSDSEDLRHSPKAVIAEMTSLPQQSICSCLSRDIERKEIETFPKFEDAASTAEHCRCRNCGREWEMAYTMTLAMCVLKSGKYDPL